MPLANTDIQLKLSTQSGAAGNTTASTPAASLGKYISTTDWSAGTNTLFDDVSGAENAAAESEYRCIFVRNAHATLTMLSAVVYLSAEVSGGAVTAIGVDTTAASAIGASAAQALSVANEDTAPAGVTFSAPTTVGTGIALGDIPAGSCRAVWIRRTTANTAAIDADGVTLAVACDTAA
jgi:hypothetical protein